jgi:hypothetical protein
VNKNAGLPLILFIIFSINLSAQIGGNSAFEVLNLTSSARIAALGGDFLTISDNDVNLAATNPSLISPGISNHLGVSYVDYYAKTNWGHATYSKSFERVGSFAATMQYLSYGEFEGADVTGEKTGKFYAGEFLFNLGWGRQLDSLFSIGSNLKFINSSKESYHSFGIAVDVAGSYISRDKSFTASFIAKNIGRQVVAYTGGNIEPMPFEIQMGLSKKLAHLPFRYSILLNHLNRWDLRYDDPNIAKVDPVTGEAVEDNGFEVFADNLMRHIIIGGELLIGKNLSVRAGYNYKRRQELKVDTKVSTVGFSWGLGIRISKFHINYARSTYHLAGSPNYISLTTNFSDLFRKSN